jgi:hypothetical protein
MSNIAQKAGVVISTPFGNVNTKTLDDKLWNDYKYVRIVVQGTIGQHRDKDAKLKDQVKSIREFLLAQNEAVNSEMVSETSSAAEEEASVNGAAAITKVVEVQHVN